MQRWATAILVAIFCCSTFGSATCRAEEKIVEGKKKASIDIARETITAQCELIKAVDVDKLKANMTDRLKDRITKEALEKAKAEVAKYTIEDLVESVEDGEFDGKKTIKIKMKNGRSLTTLVETDGKWLADTIWFK